MTHQQVLLLAASPEELRPFLRTCRHHRLAGGQGKGWRFHGPGLGGIALLVGMGGEAPRRLATEAITTHHPDLVMVCGFGGALTAEPPPAGLMVATACWRFDPSDCSLSSQPFLAAVSCLHDLLNHLQSRGLPAVAGNLITTPGVTGKHLVLPLVTNLAAPVLDLEGAEVAAAAIEHNLPFLAVRAITDGAGEEIQDFLARIINTHQGVPLSRLGAALLVQPQRLRYLLHLWSRSRQAGLNLARAMTLTLEYLTGPGFST